MASSTSNKQDHDNSQEDEGTALQTPLQTPRWKRCYSLLHNRIFISLVAGQLLSLLICGTAVTSQYLERYKVNVPMMQNVSNYLLLAATYGVVSIYRNARSLPQMMRKIGWKYLLVAFIDVEANYLIVMAYQYTSITSVQLIDCLTIPTVMILSKFLFKTLYLATHYVGVALCLVGVAGMLLADHLSRGLSFNGKNPVLGDFLIATGAIMYGFCNVGMEYLVRRGNKLDYLGWVGLFGGGISAIQMFIVEGDRLSSLADKAVPAWLCLAGFALCMFLFYSFMPWVMERSNAVMVNLSLLTADVYALVFGVFVFHYDFHVLYFLAYGVIMVGVGIYSARTSKVNIDSGGDNGEGGDNRSLTVENNNNELITVTNTV